MRSALGTAWRNDSPCCWKPRHSSTPSLLHELARQIDHTRLNRQAQLHEDESPDVSPTKSHRFGRMPNPSAPASGCLPTSARPAWSSLKAAAWACDSARRTPTFAASASAAARCSLALSRRTFNDSTSALASSNSPRWCAAEASAPCFFPITDTDTAAIETSAITSHP